MQVTVSRAVVVALSSAGVLGGCATRPPAPPAAAAPWEQRSEQLVHAHAWQLDGRAAVALGDQGWQANITWQQHDVDSEVHLSGPLGIGAVVLKLTPQGVSINGGPSGNAGVAELQDRLGFELPLAHLRFWVLGVPDPALPSDSTPNDQGRPARLTQDGWTVDYGRYAQVNGDLLPAKLSLSRDAVRVRMSVDHWTLQQ